MTLENWTIDLIDNIQAEGVTYEEDAFYTALKEVVKEQYKRIEQAEGELDGSLWSPNNW